MAESRKNTDNAGFVIVSVDNGEETVGVSTHVHDTWDACLNNLKELVGHPEALSSILVVQGRILPIKDDLSKIKFGETEISLKEDSSKYVNGFVSVGDANE